MHIYRFCIFLFIVSIIGHSLIAQQHLDQFEVLHSKGKIPEYFTILTQKKIEEIKKNTSDDYKYNKVNEEFHLKSNQFVNDLLLSGRVLFGDTITRYINKVALNLLNNSPELSEKLKFHTLKSTSVNSICTNDGIIFVNIGLIARLNNEAELAFILAHEIAHYTEKDILSNQIDIENLEKNGKYKRASYDEKIEILSAKRKETELKADSIGFLRLNNSYYNSTSALSVFEILKYSTYPFENDKFNTQLFNSNNLIIPNCYFTNKVSQIELKEDSLDANLSHPDISLRISQCNNLIETLGDAKNNHFYYSKDEFNFIRELARFELVRLQLLRRQYAEAIYSAFLLLQKFPENIYLKKCIGKALYGLTKYKNADIYHQVLIPYNEVQGESQQLNYFFRQLTKKQLNSIALKYIYDLCGDFPSDTTLKILRNDLIFDIIHYGNLDYYNLNKPCDFNIYSHFFNQLEQLDEIEKRNFIRDCQHENKNFYSGILSNIPDSNELIQVFYNEKHERDKINYFDNLTHNEKSLLIKEEKSNLKNKGHQIKAKNILLYDPDFIVINSKGEKSPIETEVNKLKLYNLLVDLCNKNGFNSLIVDSKNLNQNDQVKFRMISIVNEYLLEKFTHKDIDLTPTTIDLIYNLGIDNQFDYICYVFITKNEESFENCYNFSLFSSKTGELKYYNRIELRRTLTDKAIYKIIMQDINNIKN